MMFCIVLSEHKVRDTSAARRPTKEASQMMFDTILSDHEVRDTSATRRPTKEAAKMIMAVSG